MTTQSSSSAPKISVNYSTRVDKVGWRPRAATSVRAVVAIIITVIMLIPVVWMGMTAFKPLVETTEEEFDQIFALNAKGPYFAMQEAAKVIEDGGRIGNISSDGTHIGLANVTAYLGSKGALEQFTKGLPYELAPKGVTVNTVSPGFTETTMMPDTLREPGAQMSPFKRVGTPKDIADVVAFVLSEEARWLTGQNIHASGGVVM